MDPDRNSKRARIAYTISGLSLGLLIFILPLPAHRVLLERDIGGIYGEFTDVVLYPADLAILMLLVSSAFWFDRREKTSPGSRTVMLPLLLLAFLSAGSIFWSSDKTLALNLSLRLLLLYAAAKVLSRFQPTPEIARSSILITLLFQAGVAVTQFLIQGDLGLQWLGEQTLNRYPGGGSIIQAGGQYWLRSYGLTPHPNILGGILVISVLLTAAAALTARGPTRHFWLLSLLLGAAGLFYSFSRAAWLGGAIGGALLLGSVAWYRPMRQTHGRAALRIGLLGGILLACLAALHWPLLQTRSTPNSSEFELRSVDERATLNQAGWQLVRQSTLLGVGAGNSTPALLPLLKENPQVGAQPIHNLLILLTAELGPAGGILWLWLMLAPVAVALKRLGQGRLTLWALAITAALAAFAVIDLFDYYAWGWNQGRVLRWILWGLWAAAIDQPADGCAKPESKGIAAH